MDPDGHIYEDDPKKIPAEDKARLEGFLRGRAEAEALASLDEKIARLKVLEEAEARERG